MRHADDRMATARHLTFRTHGFTPTEAAFMTAVLNDPKSWGGYGFSFELRPWTDSRTDFDVLLTEDDMIRRLFSRTFGGMSVTDRRGARPIVHLNASNWRMPPVVSGYPFTARGIARYRTYVINHEVGHVLGLEHATCTAKSERERMPAPVMMQQTKGCGACVPDPWVIKQWS
jgi:hypothetical protein